MSKNKCITVPHSQPSSNHITIHGNNLSPNQKAWKITLIHLSLSHCKFINKWMSKSLSQCTLLFILTSTTLSVRALTALSGSITVPACEWAS